MELLFEDEARLAPTPDESIDGTEGFLIPWFESFGVV